MNIETGTKLDYSDVLLRPKRSTLTSRKEVELDRTFAFYHAKRTWSGIPIMTANMMSSGTFAMARELSKHKIITTLHKYYKISEYKKFFKDFDDPDYLVFTIGTRDADFELLQEMIKEKLINNFSFICIDVPNGYLANLLEYVERVRKLCPNHIIIAGNVVSREITEELILRGADIVKVGIGPGAACTTRKMTGVGIPQLSAVIECADAAHGLDSGQGHGLIIADGGLVSPGDAGKAFAAGADFIMSGQFFSGYEESDGETVERDGKLYKEYIGSSSNRALEKFYGKKDKHRASEGRVTYIPHKGSVHGFIQDLFGALRSTGTYIGARRIKEFPRRATFVRVNNQINTSLAQYDTDNK